MKTLTVSGLSYNVTCTNFRPSLWSTPLLFNSVSKFGTKQGEKIVAKWLLMTWIKTYIKERSSFQTYAVIFEGLNKLQVFRSEIGHNHKGRLYPHSILSLELMMVEDPSFDHAKICQKHPLHPKLGWRWGQDKLLLIKPPRLQDL